MQKITRPLLLLLTLSSSLPALAEESKFVVLPGDLLQISVWKEEGMDQEVLVLPDGTITFPLVGTLQVQGMALEELKLALSEELQSLIPDAAVAVSVKAPTGHKVSVIGQVQKPGEIILSNSMGVMQALSQVGGLTPYANENNIVIIRKNAEGKKEKISFPYAAIAKGNDLEKDIDLIPGDVVIVSASGLF